jgi:hypothetical protein
MSNLALTGPAAAAHFGLDGFRDIRWCSAIWGSSNSIPVSFTKVALKKTTDDKRPTTSLGLPGSVSRRLSSPRIQNVFAWRSSGNWREHVARKSPFRARKHPNRCHGGLFCVLA